MRLIDADVLKEEVNKKNVVGRFNLLLLIDNVPTIEVSGLPKIHYDRGFIAGYEKGKRPQGEWIPNDKISPWGNPGRSCSLCGKIVEFSENFCPKCGADMRGKDND